MSVRDITSDSVLAAIRAGDDDFFKLAETFGVLHVSHTLRSALNQLGGHGVVSVDADNDHRIELREVA